MNLTPEQIQYIHDFVRRKYVDYYDVQIELVDHIATAIEEKIEANPKLDFYTALQEVYDGFGRFGFVKFVEEKEKQVQWRFRKMYSREVQNFFTIPRVLFTVAFFFLSYQFYKVSPYVVSKNVTLILFTFLVFFQIVGYVWEKNKLRKELISINSPITAALIFNLVNQAINLSAFEKFHQDSIWWLPFIATFMVIGNLSNFIVSRKLRTEQRRLYPEAFAA